MFFSDRIRGLLQIKMTKLGRRSSLLYLHSHGAYINVNFPVLCFHIHKMSLEEYVDLARQVDKTLVLRSLGLATVLLLRAPSSKGLNH